jgi:hypothetical protein
MSQPTLKVSSEEIVSPQQHPIPEEYWLIVPVVQQSAIIYLMNL